MTRWRRSGPLLDSTVGRYKFRSQTSHPVAKNATRVGHANPHGILQVAGRFASQAGLLRSGMKTTKKKSQTIGTMRLRIERAIRSIPRGKVSTYGGIARMAGYPGAARLVARVLQRGYGLPWQRVLGAGGEIKLTGDSAIEQRLRLEAEGVRFRGRKVDLRTHEYAASRRKARSKKTS